jgi:EAL and modified HD-GYP domain-containing signal transduction protein
MAGFLDRLLGKGDAPATSVPPPPGKAPHARVTEQAPSFVCREPVLDREKRISGYQFSLPEEIERRLPNDFQFLPKIYDDAVLRNLTAPGDATLLGPRLAFVRLAPDSLDNARIHQLPARNTVLMLAPVHPTFDAAHVRTRLDGLGQAGFAHGWLLRQGQLARFPELATLAASADFVQIDATGFDGMEAKLLLKSLLAARPSGRTGLSLVAGGLNVVDEYHLYSQLGFDHFLGPFVTRREDWRPPKSDINRLRVIRLLNLLRGDSEIPQIAEELRHDPVLAFKLLRYINSPSIGLASPVSTMDKALILLGREKFYRWLSLLLFDFKTPGYSERVLTEQALSRARFLESLAAQGSLPAKADWLFILGLFSLIDQLMGQPMADLLLQVKLPEPVHDALLGQPGIYRDALRLAVAAEGQSPRELAELAALCGMEPQQVAQCGIQSLTWAHEIASLSDSQGRASS